METVPFCRTRPRFAVTALDVRCLSVTYGGIVALEDVSFVVQEGELVGLIGPNGAGKTTLVDAVTGFARYDGSVFVSGACIDGARPHERATRGLGRTFQSLELIDDLTVAENVALGARGSRDAAAAALTATQLTAVAGALPQTLGPGTRRFVALARALAGRPRVLLLDEIAAGLDEGERSALARCLRAAAKDGVGVVLVDHDLGLVTELSQRVVVLAAGRVIASGPADDVRQDQRVVAAYLGRA